MKNKKLFSILFIFSSFLLGQEGTSLLGQKWKSYYFPLKNPTISSLVIYGDGYYSYKDLKIKEDLFPYSDGFYLWSFIEEREFNQRILLTLNYEDNGDTYFLIDEGFWDEDFYGFNFDKETLEKLNFSKMSHMEYEEKWPVYKLTIKMPVEGYYNLEGIKIIKGIVLLGSEEFKSYYSSEYIPIKYIPYNGEDKIEIILDRIPYPVLTYTFIIEDFKSKELEKFPLMPLVSKPLIFINSSEPIFFMKNVNFKRKEGLYLKAIAEKGNAKLEWKYQGNINNRSFIIYGGFDGENYYPIAEIKAEEFSYIEEDFFVYSFEHFLGERSAGIFYAIELKDESGNVKDISWTRLRQK